VRPAARSPGLFRAGVSETSSTDCVVDVTALSHEAPSVTGSSPLEGSRYPWDAVHQSAGDDRVVARQGALPAVELAEGGGSVTKGGIQRWKVSGHPQRSEHCTEGDKPQHAQTEP
jgi:hypothetical protein